MVLYTTLYHCLIIIRLKEPIVKGFFVLRGFLMRLANVQSIGVYREIPGKVG